MIDSSDELLPRPYRGSLEQLRGAPDAADTRRSLLPTPGLLPPGARFGSYRIERLLGSGGMGRVYLARDASGAPVALKLARTDRDNRQLNRRLQNEATALAGLKHPNIARLLDRGEVDGVFFIATEFIDGPDLLQWARSQQPSPAEALRVAERLAAAMQACHDHRVVHRDLSPSNVIVRADGDPVLVDFGLGVDLGRDQGESKLTQTGHIAGKYAYLAPEARAGAATDTGFDCYAFGGCLYAMWARQEFDPRQLHELYPGPESRGDLFARKLKLIARKCLAAEPRHRFRSAQQIREALQHALHPPPRWRGQLLVGAAVAWILGLFAVAQHAGGMFWSHALHVGMLALFGGRALWVWRRGEHHLELARFMPGVWATFLCYYGFNLAVAGEGITAPWLGLIDAGLSNATGVALLLAFCALWMPTRAGSGSSYPRARLAIFGVWAALSTIAGWVAWRSRGAPDAATVLELVQLPSSLFVGAALCTLAVGLGQKTLQVPFVALLTLLLYGLVQLLYPAFGWIESRGESWLIAVYGLGMIGKLALFVSVESIQRSWALFGYEGELSSEW